MNAQVDIVIGVNGRKRDLDEPFTPVVMTTSPYHFSTDLDDYPDTVDSIANIIWADVDSMRTAGYECVTRVGIRLDNPTHPTPAKGVVPLAKGHMDTSLTDGDYTEASVLHELITNVILDLKSLAKY